MQKLLIIDGQYLAYKNLLGMPELNRKSDGALVGAAIGFINQLTTLMSYVQPTHAICIFDGARANFRTHLNTEYKDNRVKKEFDSEALWQLSFMHAFASAYMTCVVSNGVEADDLLASYAKAFTKGETYIAAVDKDMLQLIDKSTTVINVQRGIVEVRDAKYVKEKWGITPKQCATYQALVGDGTDNFFGIAGVGQVQATKFIKKYGTLENILDAAFDNSPAVARMLATQIDAALCSYKQSKLDTEVPLPISIASTVVKASLKEALSLVCALEATNTLSRLCKLYRVNINQIQPHSKWASKVKENVSSSRKLFAA